jgi:membrane-bound metal-dependent hydrolase YbcI (DUF457 family)
MAGFKTHVSVSAALGVGYGIMGYACGLAPSTALVAAGLCTIGGMLPDMDGDTGVAVREIVPITAAVIPVLMLDIFKYWGLDREQIFIAVMGLYFLIRFGIGLPFKKLTRHRGMWHSIPAAINVGLICFLVCSYQDLGPRLFKSIAISIGFISHLLLDEVWSVGWFRLKQSAGTAFKLFTRERVWPNLLTYGILLGLGYYSFFLDSSFKRDYQAWRSGEIKLNLKPDWKRFQITASEKTPTATLPVENSPIEAALEQ